jgi:hypothetical protein
MNAQRKRAAIFFVEGYISIQPSVVGAATELAERGYDIDLFYIRPAFSVPALNLPAAIRMREYSWRKLNFTKVTQRILRVSWRVSELVRKSEPLINDFIKFVGFVWFCRQRARAVDVAIAFDMTGLAAMTIALPRKVPFIYWSLEISLLSELNTLGSILQKRLEMRRLEVARAIVVQSSERAQLLSLDSGCAKERFTIVPNSPPGPRPEDLPRDFFTRRFNIPRTATIVLCAGMIAPLVHSREIAAASTSWSPKFVLVFHERLRNPSGYLRSVQAAGGNRVFLSLDPVPFNSVDVIFAAAHIGIVSYESVNSNYATTLMSSGKLSYYLRNGLPVVIVTRSPPPFMKRWMCGLCVAEIGEIGQALIEIQADYSRFSEQAKRCYDELFDFGRAFARLLARANLDFSLKRLRGDGTTTTLSGATHCRCD